MTDANRCWHIGRNLAGYLPESDVSCVDSWSDAVALVSADMRDYADTDDDAAYESLTMGPQDDYPLSEDGSRDYGDDAPTMLATVGAILTDDSPRDGDAAHGWNALIDDNDGRTLSFWIMPADHGPDDACDADNVMRKGEWLYS